MKFYAQSHLRIQKDVCTRIIRKLKGKGTIEVVVGQEVTPSDIIGTALVSSGFHILKLAQLLQIHPNEVEKYMKRKLAQRIYKGELLASKKNWLGVANNIISPTDGVLDSLDSKTGELRLSFVEKKQILPAGVYGIIDAIDNARGQILIKTQVSMLYGLFGLGTVRDGILNIISKRDELVGKNFISHKQDGQILVGGSLIFRDTIISAISSGVAGIITGGMNAKEYIGITGGRLIFPRKAENEVGISIIVCEGFGSIPIGEDIYEFLRQYNNRFVSIDGNSGIINLPSFESNSIIKLRKIALPPIVAKTLIINPKRDQQMVELKIGAQVRIIGNSYAGEQGKIIAIDQTDSIMASGVRSFMSTIETKRHKIQVPVANISVIL